MIPEVRFISPQEDDHDLDQETIFTNGFMTLENSYGFPADVNWRLEGCVMPRFHKLENCLMRDNAFFALKGQVQRAMDHGPLDGMIRLS